MVFNKEFVVPDDFFSSMARVEWRTAAVGFISSAMVESLFHLFISN